jgi:hypothetical protein
MLVGVPMMDFEGQIRFRVWRIRETHFRLFALVNGAADGTADAVVVKMVLAAAGGRFDGAAIVDVVGDCRELSTTQVDWGRFLQVFWNWDVK